MKMLYGDFSATVDGKDIFKYKIGMKVYTKLLSKIKLE
jgi:hypothetical protein